MVRTSKSDKLAPVENVVVPAPATVEAVKATAKPRAKKADKEAAVVPAAPVVAAAPATSEQPPVVEESSVAIKIQEFGAKLQQMAGLFASMKADYKTLEKVFGRELKNAQKNSKKRRTTGNRQPSGFVKPTRISDELAKFLGKSVGTEMARTEVSKEINAYIREKGLQDKENGRKIHPDASLSKLLALGSSDELTYFNLQRYMKHHFIKEVAAAAVAVA